jgi:hypothetical protein
MKKQLFLNCSFDLYPYAKRIHPSSLEINSAIVQRLLIWQYFHHISKLFNSSLIVNSSWPESLVLDLPDTEFCDSSYLENKEYYKLDETTITKKISSLLQTYIFSKSIVDPILNEDVWSPCSGGGGLTPSDGVDTYTFYSKIIVYLNNNLQKSDISYTFKGNRIFFTEPPKKGDNCSVFYYKGSYEDVDDIKQDFNIDNLDKNKFLVFDNISKEFDGKKTKFQLSLTEPKFKQIAHSILTPCDNSDNSIFNVDGKEYDLLYFECDFINNSPNLFNKVYDRMIDFVNIHSDCAKTAGFFYNIREIKFKDDRVNKFFKDNFSNVAGVHLRRGLSSQINGKYINDLKQYVDPKLVKKYYNHLHFVDGGIGHLPIYTDDYYFERIDKILSETPDKKIYLSYDVPKPFINHFLEKYPKNIVTRSDYLDEYLSYFSDIDIENSSQYKFSIKKSLIDLLDLFALAYSDLLVFRKIRENPRFSKWLFFAKCYNGKDII